MTLGHEVKLIAPQHVKAFVRGQKNDYNDASAIAEAKGVKTLFTETTDYPFYDRLLNDSPNERKGNLPTFSFSVLKKDNVSNC